MEEKTVKKKSIAAFIILGVSVLLTILLSPYIFNIENINDYNENARSLRIHIKDEVVDNSYGREMRIVNLWINDEEIKLQDYNNSGWEWHGEWGYTLYKDAAEDFVIEYDEAIKGINMEYVEQEGSGIAEIFVGNEKIDEINMYKSSWYNNKKYYSFVTDTEKIEKYVWNFALFVLISYVIYKIIDNIFSKKTDKKYGVSSSLGMFDAAKGLSMVIIILGHTMVDVSEQMEKSNGSLLLLVLSFFVATGLMPMFYMMSGYGFRGEKNIKCIKKQIKFLLKPYCVLAVFTIIASFIKVFVMDNYNLGNVKTLVLSFASFNTINSTVRGIDLISVGPIWFCIQLCIAWIILNIIFRIKKNTLRYMVIVGVLVAGQMIEKLPYNVHARMQFIPAIIFIFVGYLIREKKIFQKENKYTLIQYFLVVIVASLIILINGIGEAASNNWGRYYILGIVSSAVMGVVLLRMYMILNSKVDLKIFKKIGRNTYDIIYIHTFEYLVMPWKEIMSSIEIPFIAKFFIVSISRAVIIWVVYMLVLKFRTIIKNRRI